MHITRKHEITYDLGLHFSLYYYSYGEHCWVFLQICINFNRKWRASNTFEAHSGGPQMYLRPATGKHGHLHAYVFFSYNVTTLYKLSILVSLILSYS